MKGITKEKNESNNEQKVLGGSQKAVLLKSLSRGVTGGGYKKQGCTGCVNKASKLVSPKTKTWIAYMWYKSFLHYFLHLENIHI